MTPTIGRDALGLLDIPHPGTYFPHETIYARPKRACGRPGPRLLTRLRAGSRDDAKKARGILQALLGDAQRRSVYFETLLEAARVKHIYLLLEDAQGRPFPSWEQFVTAAVPWGLGVSAAAIELILTERDDHALRARLLAADAKPLLPQGKRHTRETAGTAARCAPGTSSHYLVARLARDHPEYIERLRAGEFRSAHEAAVAAGIATPSFTLRLEPVAIARQLLKLARPLDVQRVVALLTDPGWLNGPLGNAQRRRPVDVGVEAAA